MVIRSLTMSKTIALLFLLALASCGASSSAKLMVDSPIYQFEPPDEDDLVEEEDDDADKTAGDQE